MASQRTTENVLQQKSCHCAEGDSNVFAARSSKCPNCQVFKSGPLFISSKGIGWTSWKKRWFILTRTSLVFYRNDPSAPLQRGSEANVTLGGIDLNSSGSVVVKADKKLLTVLFPDGRDGRAFTLKAETSEELLEWKIALENALAQAPSAALVLGQNGIFRNDAAEAIEGSFEQWRDRKPVKSLVVGRPILLALEDIDGSPSFLEKALRFLELYGIKIEGILRQSADVDEVDRRIQEFEHGKIEFSPDEDAHVVSDCVKHVLRELPSSPVPASCCNALLDACRIDRGSRAAAIRAAVCETFPEPNRRLLQRILKMMRTVASHKCENRMTLSAVAACMAPLLLRPLLAGDCELEDEFDMPGDGSIQLLRAAAAANHAQAIVITLLEEYDNIFVDDILPVESFSSEPYTDSEDCDVEDGLTDDEILEDDGYHDAQNDIDVEHEDDTERTQSGSLSESSSDMESDLYDTKNSECQGSDPTSPASSEDNEGTPLPCNIEDLSLLNDINQKPLNTSDTKLVQNNIAQCGVNSHNQSNSFATVYTTSLETVGDVSSSSNVLPKSIGHSSSLSIPKSSDRTDGQVIPVKRPTIWGRTSARKNLSMESIDYSSDDEVTIQRLEITKLELQGKLSKEIKENADMQESLERKKQDLHERRVALKKDVERLQEQLQKERGIRASLEAGLNMKAGKLPIMSGMNDKVKADIEEIAFAEADINSLNDKVSDLHRQLNQQDRHNYGFICELCKQHRHASNETKLQDEPNHAGTTSVHPESSPSEDVMHGSDSEVSKRRAQNSSPLQSNQPSPMQHADSTSLCSDKSLETDGRSSTEEFTRAGSTGDSNKSSSKVEEPPKVGKSSTSRKSSDKGETVLVGSEGEGIKTQKQDSISSPNKQPSQKQVPDSTSQYRTKSVGPGLGGSSTEESSTVGLNIVLKKSSAKREETVSTSSALARLTNRFNFLKERRVQLVNELQTLENSRPLSQEATPVSPNPSPSTSTHSR
ncbi:hypothetical protein QJS04_geneDACA003749 [Acorus gramineus]|uniref:Rho GTPase-activating protein REN1-like n=1 Tax=Acorus gramineus TaxID=55184 RepID=A0AAV9BJC1_ACOGR|nr:hypothetical protein QJS04_geneDACA003749 [Acorus gramineus]